MAIKQLFIESVQIQGGAFVAQAKIVSAESDKDEGATISAAFRLPLVDDQELDGLCTKIGEVLKAKILAALGQKEAEKVGVPS